MIHSLSGGVIKENGVHTFVKVRFLEPPFDDRPYWYICPFREIAEGDWVYAPIGRDGLPKRAQVIKVLRDCNEQLSPVPMNRIKEITRMA